MLIDKYAVIPRSINSFAISTIPESSTKPYSALSATTALQVGPRGTGVVSVQGEWVPGVCYQITEGDSQYRYLVADEQVYEPDQIILWNSIDSLEDIRRNGFIEISEQGALANASTNGLALFDELASILVQVIEYPDPGGSVVSSELAHRLRGLRCMQKFLYLFGLESVCKYLLPVSSLDTGWFLSTYIQGTRLDSSILEEIPRLSYSLSKTANLLRNSNDSLHSDMMGLVDQIVSEKSEYKALLKACILALVSLVRL